MSFTDQKQWIVTEQDMKANWSGYKNGKRFYCKLCGHQFQVGDKCRWVYAGASAKPNLLVCENCDGKDVLERWEARWREWDELSTTKFRFIADLYAGSE